MEPESGEQRRTWLGAVGFKFDSREVWGVVVVKLCLPTMRKKWMLTDTLQKSSSSKAELAPRQKEGPCGGKKHSTFFLATPPSARAFLRLQSLASP